MAKDYLSDKTRLKTPLAQLVTSKSTSEGIQQIGTLLSDLRTRALGLADTWIMLESAVEQLWISMLSETTLTNFLEMIHDDYLDYLSSQENEETYIRIFASMLGRESDEVRGQYPNTDLLHMLNADFHTANLSQKLREITEAFSQMKSDTDVMSYLHEQGDVFIKQFQQYGTSLEGFLLESHINADFFM